MFVFRYDMAELQMKLKQYEKAEKTLQQALDTDDNVQNSDINTMMSEVKLRTLLAKVNFRFFSCLLVSRLFDRY